jgi:hypothetical protein
MLDTDQGLLAESPGLFIGIAIIAVWSFVWKGFALYRAGANRSVAWFVVFMILNTAGILEILYLFVFSKKPHSNQPIYSAPVAPAAPADPTS